MYICHFQTEVENPYSHIIMCFPQEELWIQHTLYFAALKRQEQVNK